MEYKSIVPIWIPPSLDIYTYVLCVFLLRVRLSGILCIYRLDLHGKRRRIQANLYRCWKSIPSIRKYPHSMMNIYHHYVCLSACPNSHHTVKKGMCYFCPRIMCDVMFLCTLRQCADLDLDSDLGMGVRKKLRCEDKSTKNWSHT